MALWVHKKNAREIKKCRQEFHLYLYSFGVLLLGLCIVYIVYSVHLYVQACLHVRCMSVYIDMYKFLWACIYGHVETEVLTSGVFQNPSLLHMRRFWMQCSGVSYLLSRFGIPCLCLLCMRITCKVTKPTRFYMNSGDLNSGPHDYVVSVWFIP